MAALVVASAAPARVRHHRPRANCSTAPHSWVAGSVWLCRGVLTYGDYVDDDYGADTGQINTTSRSASLMPSAGDQGYRMGQDATADLILLTLRVRGHRLFVSGLVNALYQPRETVLAVAIDTDNNPRTGGGRWGQLDVSSGGWDRIAFFTNGDPKTNTISGSMPLPPGRVWRVQAATAIASSGQVMNVAFRGPGEQASAKGVGTSSDSGAWFEDKQAAALGRGDISEFGTVVRGSDLTHHRTRAAPNPAGLHERVYRSAYTVPPAEGVNVAGVPGRGNGGGQVSLGFEQTFQYLGRYQPYGIYIPRKPGPHGMQMLFHGSSSGMSGLVNQPGMEQRFGEDLNRVLVVPEARGQNGWGSDISERDLLDVMSDIQAHYPIDSQRVFSGGYSQGGYITYRMAELYPDRFAGAVDWVGFTGDEGNGSPSPAHYTAGAIGNVIDYVANLRSVPTVMLYSGADELVHVWTANAMDQAFDATDDVFTFYLHPAAEHLTFAALDDWTKEAAYTRDLKLVSNPPRVTYRTETYLDDPGLGIVHDRAYWVSAIRGRQTGQVAENVDLQTLACGGSTPVLKRSSGSGSDPVPWTSDVQSVAQTTPIARALRLQGSLGNVASLHIDTRRACLAGQAFSYSITTDGTSTVSLSDGRTFTLSGSDLHTGAVPGR
ncbi:MAG TPA: prolyl oligopeptidase family serine peptidase [Solirubrobacteraceae bacterium]|nr:prolyl oligopeptidase family serine peptidase [Solirubrobacteraceae bacterium]